ncbi:MAG: hypothetical protein AB8G14_17520 [Ilumatobacter sp.]
MQRTIRILAATSALALLGTSCGRIVERATERATEEVVERAIEADTGGDVDVDFSDGEIRVESSEGDVTFNVDENGVQIEGVDADGNEFSVDGDENGFDIDTEDGTLTVDDDGSFTATDENGEVLTGEADGDGGFVVEGADGESVFATTADIPEQWPSDIPQPQGLSNISGTYFSEGDESGIVVTGMVAGALTDVFEDYTSALMAAGFEEESTFVQADEIASGTFLRGDELVSVSVSARGDSSEMVITVDA